MKWPLGARISDQDIPLYNRYYLHAPKASDVDPVIVMGTEIEVDALLAFLQERNSRGGSPIVTTAHALIRATALGLREFPEMNVRVVGRRVYAFRNVSIRMGFFHRKNKEIDLLLVSSADTKGIDQIATEVWRRLLEAARGTGPRDRDLARMRKVPAFWFRQLMQFYGWLDRHFHLPAITRLDELRGGSAMVNDLSHAGAPPMRGYKPSRFADGSDSVNLTLGPVENKLIMQDGEVRQIRVMPLFLRADHRTVDAYQIGRFLAFVRETLQHPKRLDVQQGEKPAQ
jgi:pyruvate/2-oxoglutarate dehydrogenase complex dihydrolipoamide acyltransferase (E2) component